jgi:hypothetical protein
VEKWQNQEARAAIIKEPLEKERRLGNLEDRSFAEAVDIALLQLGSIIIKI